MPSVEAAPLSREAVKHYEIITLHQYYKPEVRLFVLIV